MSQEQQQPSKEEQERRQKLEDLMDAAIDGLTADLSNPETRSAAKLDVARKFLKDADIQATGKTIGKLTPLTRSLPHRSTEPIPPASAG